MNVLNNVANYNRMPPVAPRHPNTFTLFGIKLQNLSIYYGLNS